LDLLQHLDGDFNAGFISVLCFLGWRRWYQQAGL
jgi:hypothetical protein